MAAAVSKLMRVQDLIAAATKIRVVTRFRTTIGLAGRLSARLQPNHPTDAPEGIAAAILDGLLLGSGDAVIGINPAADDVALTGKLLRMIDALRRAVRNPSAELRSGTHNDADGCARCRCAGGSDLSIDRWNGGGKSQSLG